MKSGMKSKGVSGEFEISEFEISGFYLFYFIYFICHTIITKKPVKKCNRANTFCRKLKEEGSVIFQNIFSSMADSPDVVSVLPCSPTDKSK